MILLRNTSILAKHTRYQASLGNCSCIALLPAVHGSIYSFWKNLSGPMFNLFWERFACNHSLCTGSAVVGQCMEQRSGVPNGYGLITGVLPVTLRARFAHVKLFLQFYQRIGQTTATDGGSVDFASLHGCNLVGQCRSNCRGASHRPDSLIFLQNSAFL